MLQHSTNLAKIVSGLGSVDRKMVMESYAIRSTKHKAILVWTFGNSSLGPIPHRIHVWYIYPHLFYFMVNVGKYTSPMDGIFYQKDRPESGS